MKKFIISLILTAIILFFVLKRIDFGIVFEVIKNSNLLGFLVALILQVSIVFVSAIRWSEFFKLDGSAIDFLYIFRLTYIGSFFNNILPSATGGDLVRAYYIYKSGYDATRSFSPIIVERVVGLVTTLGMAAIAVQFVDIRNAGFSQIQLLLPIIFISFLFFIFLLNVPFVYNLIYKALSHKEEYRIVAALLRIIKSIQLYLGNGYLMIRVGMISTIIHIIAVMVVWLLTLSIGSDVSFVLVMVIAPTVFAISGIPVSIGGLGLREGAMITLFSMAGMGLNQAASLSIVFVFILFFSSLPGFILFFLERSRFPIVEGINGQVVYRKNSSYQK